MVFTITQPKAELEAQVYGLGGLRVVVPDEPGREGFEFEAPAVALAQRNFDFQVGGRCTQQEQVGLDGPGFGLIGFLPDTGRCNDRGGVRLVIVFVDDDHSLLDDDRIADHQCIALGVPGDNHGTGSAAAQRRQVFLHELRPDRAVAESAKAHLAWVKIARVGVHIGLDDAEHHVAPGLVTGRHQVVEVVPAWAEVMEIDGSCLIPQAFPQVCGDGFSPGLAQLHVAVAGPFRRSAGVDVELDADGVAVAVFLLEALLETLPVLGVVGIRKVEFGAIEAEAKRYRIAVSTCLGNQS